MRNGASIEKYMNITIRRIEWIHQIVKERGELNEQYFLDFQDKLNALSLDPDQ
jgi:hypothetical protein